MEDNSTLQYLAGFIDGEGSISVNLSKNPKGRRRWYLRMTCHQVNPAPLELLINTFGGSLRYSRRTATQRPIHEWAISSNEAYSAIKRLRPYLIVKAKEADLAMKFQELLWSRKNDKTLLTEDEERERERIYNALREMKRSEHAQHGMSFKEPRIQKVKRLPKHRIRVAEPVVSTGYDKKKKPERGELVSHYQEDGPVWCARHYGVSRQTVYNWLDAYEIPRQGRTEQSERRRIARVAATWAE